MDHKVFKCNITGYSLSFIIDINKLNAHFDEIVCDYKNIKMFFLLIRNSIDKLKECGIKTISQYVSVDEYEQFLAKAGFVITERGEGFFRVSCNICDFLECYGRGIGIVG